jgi:SAM-dependent methyltransferase
VLDDAVLDLLGSCAAANERTGRDDGAVGSLPFVDDFTAAEARDAPPPRLLHRALAPIVEDAVAGGPLGWIASQLGRPTTALEIGPGAGGLIALLADVVRRSCVTVDVSLRAVLLATARGGAKVSGVVADATALPFAAEQFDLVVGNNVVDIVDEPSTMIAHATRVLRPGGRLILTTPHPALDGQAGRDDRALENTLRTHGLVIDDVEDGILWPRVHGPRHVELWVCRGVVASRPAGRG